MNPCSMNPYNGSVDSSSKDEWYEGSSETKPRTGRGKSLTSTSSIYVAYWFSDGPIWESARGVIRLSCG